MSGRTVAAHIDALSADRLKAVARDEGRSPSQIAGVATKAMLNLSPAARRAIIALDSGASEAERNFAYRLLGRAALKAREHIIDARNATPYLPVTNVALDSDEAVEAEAVAALRR